MRFIRITASNFCAAAEVENSIIVNAAPIIKWMQGSTLWWVQRYCEKWELEIYEIK